MKYIELAEIIKSGIRPAVTFKKAIEDKEGYAEGGMRARLIRADSRNDQVMVLLVDYSEFDEFNKQFESSNYYDKSGAACWNARQAGQYKMQDEIYADSDYTIDDDMEIERSERLKLYDGFKAASTNATYVQWLEDQLLAKVVV